MPRSPRRHGGRSPKPVWIIACEDTKSVPPYLRCLVALHRDPVSLKFATEHRHRTSPRQVVERSANKIKQLHGSSNHAEENTNDIAWAIIDADPQDGPQRQQQIHEAIQYAEENSVRLIISNPCFEHWIRLYVEDCDGGHASCRIVVEALKQSWGTHFRAPYEKSNPDYSRLTLDCISTAITRAERQHYRQGGKRAHDCNPCVTEFYKLAKCLREASDTADGS